MDKKKLILGQFFTKESNWLRKHIKKFIMESECTIAYDPFAGLGDLLEAIREIKSIKKTYGLDIDTALNWQYNNSLENIPK